ncbi:MAG: hypothetical protein ACKO7R_05530 [Pseudanabaena sp.]
MFPAWIVITQQVGGGEDGEALAETSVHADAIIATVAVLRNYLAEKFAERSPIVLADQFLYIL